MVCAGCTCSCCVYHKFVLIRAGGSTCNARYQVVTVKADGSLVIIDQRVVCWVFDYCAKYHHRPHRWCGVAMREHTTRSGFVAFVISWVQCSLFLWRNMPIVRCTKYRHTDFCSNIYADIHSFVVDHGVLDVQPTQLWWSCWNEGALLLISVKLSLILRSSALFLVTPMHNYEEIWMFTQATACSNIVMFLCCVLWRDDCILVCLQYRQRHRLTSRSSPSAPR